MNKKLKMFCLGLISAILCAAFIFGSIQAGGCDELAQRKNDQPVEVPRMPRPETKIDGLRRERFPPLPKDKYNNSSAIQELEKLS